MNNEEGLDIANLPNPYDFSHPVTRPEFFSGREEIVSTLTYYLDHAELDERPCNIALLGPRASGKTSILNYIGWEAEDRGYCVARVSLNESDSESDLAFFFKLFDAVFSAACRQVVDVIDGEEVLAFDGGINGETYDTYLEMTTAFTIPPNRRLRPFTFPTIYAHAMAAGRRDVLVSEDRFIDDLRKIHSEVDRPIVILFDEANVLSLNRVLLQKIRQVFMNCAGYMLVLVGTESLFPVMDEVFSPIARDFKRIKVGNFATVNEAIECVTKPLENIGINDPKSLMSSETLRDLVNPKGLTGGSPYQIQLACHYLFRSMQSTRSRKMELTVDAIDGVLSEIAGGVELRHSHVLKAFQGLSTEEIEELDRLVLGNGSVALTEVEFASRVLLGEPKITLDDLKTASDKYVHLGLLEQEGDRVRFKGDERESLYAKYYARKLGIHFSVDEIHPINVGMLSIQYRLEAKSKWKSFSPSFVVLQGEDGPGFEVDWIFEALLTDTEVPYIQESASSLAKGLAVELYMNLQEFVFDGITECSIASLEVASAQSRRIGIFINRSVTDDCEHVIRELARSLNELAEGVGGYATVRIRDVRFLNRAQLWHRVQSFLDDHRQTALYSFHAGLMTESYVQRRDPVLATWFLDRLLEASSGTSSSPILGNNAAYLLMVNGRWLEAIEALIVLKEDAEEAYDRVLVGFNLSVSYWAIGNLEGACTELQSVLAFPGIDDKNWEAACLLIPRVENGNLLLCEEWDVALLDAARKVLEALENIGVEDTSRMEVKLLRTSCEQEHATA